ncbi:MAG: N-formylglutamate amidohydrolase [Pyrinomonadaceae bacterium]
MLEPPFYIREPVTTPIPLIVSVPHCGTEFPPELAENYLPEQTAALDDTDWFVEKLYDFVPNIGGTLIYAKFSRWVIDLNREPGGAPLYDDGRLTTAICPTTDFFGNPIYKGAEFEPDDREISRRLESYFAPYHDKINRIIKTLKQLRGNVLFLDGHSIRRNVPTISNRPFPDLILGTNDGKSTTDIFESRTLELLRNTGRQISLNSPFKGGYLTRSKGNPDSGVSALQLEMSKDIYMKNGETELCTESAANLAADLKTLLVNLIKLL